MRCIPNRYERDGIKEIQKTYINMKDDNRSHSRAHFLLKVFFFKTSSSSFKFL